MEQSPVTAGNPKLLTLPVELLVYIVSFLTDIREKVKLRYVSRRLRSVSETPSLWRKFIWPYYSSVEERCLCNLLKTCGNHIGQLSFPHHVTPSKLVKFLQYCGNVRHLSLPHVTKFSLEQLTKILQHMEGLSVLKVRLSVEISSLLQLTSSVAIEDLTVYVRDQNPDDCMNWYVHMLHEWVVNENAPKILNVVILEYDDIDSLQLHLIHNWSQWNVDMPATRTSCLRLYVYENMYLPLNHSYSLPIFQLQYGQGSHLPLVKASKFGLLGLRNDLLLLTDCTYKSKRIDKATVFCLPRFNDPIISIIVDLAFVTYFDVGPSERCLCSGHLEQLALACPNLVWLRLHRNHQCLKSLQGLQVISKCCQKLQALNLLGVQISNIQSQVKLWDILSSMKLTQLAVELCTLMPLHKHDTNKLIRRYQKCLTLQKLELDAFCEDCGDIDDDRPFLLTHFPLLESCKLFDVQQPHSAQEIITTCQGLKVFECNCIQYLTFSLALNCNLEQLLIVSENTDVDVAFFDTVSAHGGLVHVVLSIDSLPSEGITALIENSPKMLTCNIFTFDQVYDSEGMKVNLKDLKATLKAKYSHRQLFTCGNLRLVQSKNELDAIILDTFCNLDFVQLTEDTL